MKYLISFIIVVVVFSSITFALPQPSGFVNDYANVLPNRAALESILSDFEKNTTIEIAVVTINELPQDQTTATYAVELFQQWGIGKKGEDNGILILIVKNGTTGNRMRIELGYGIQGYITGAEAGRILDSSMSYYESGDYGKTTETILYGLFEQLNEYVPGERVESSNYYEIANVVISFLPMILIFVFIVLSATFSEKCPDCGSRKLVCEDEFCTCRKCGKRFKRKRKTGFIPIFIGGFGGGGGGFGGFGGGGSGGGGAGR